MGTYYRVNYWSDIDEFAIKSMIEEELSEIDQQLSNWNSNSWISQFNRASKDSFVFIPEHAREVFKYYQKLNRQSAGALDPTLGKVISLWGFGPERIDTLPSSESIQKVIGLTGINNIQLSYNPPRIAKANNNLQFNFSALTKGYAADILAQQMEELGIVYYLINIGGDIRVGKHPSKVPGWEVAIQRPDAREGRAYTNISMKNVGLATSGDYRRFRKADGKRYPHIINPKTGYPVQNNLASVTVLAPKTALADGWATAGMVLGAQKARELIDATKNVEALFIERLEQNKFRTLTTSGWPDQSSKEKTNK